MCASAGLIGQPFDQYEAGGFAYGHWVSAADAPPIEPHGHTQAHFIFVTAGAFVSDARGGGSSPALIFNPADTYHADHFERGGGFFSVTTPALAQTFARDWRLPRDPSYVAAERAFVTLWRLMRASTRDADAESLCLELMDAAGDGPKPDRAAPRWLATACDLLRDAGAADARVGAVAAAVGVHPIHLARSFRRFLGCTPGEYLRAHRSHRAASALAKTRFSLAHIAADCGYADQSHLVRSFRDFYGVTPEQFRRALN